MELPLDLEMIINLTIILTCIAIASYFLKHMIKSAILSLYKAQKQTKSVNARMRNKMTKAIWEDALDVKLAGIIPVNVEGFLWDMFPRFMEIQEEMRTKNPVAWRENMKYLLPLMVSVKGYSLYKGQEFLQRAIGNVTEFLNGVAGDREETPPEDKISDKDINNK